MPEICLFPIPNCVTFPGTIFPLHVFEPRYRMMIDFCLNNNVLLGICHTQRQISSNKPNQTVEEALQSNQATYIPHDIFSAGYCELLDKTDDGRMYLNVHIQGRYHAESEKQTIPYLIYDCELYPDFEISSVEQQHGCELKQQLLTRLQHLTQNDPELNSKFQPAVWDSKSLSEFSFELFSTLSFEAEVQQKILSLRSINERLQAALQLLS